MPLVVGGGGIRQQRLPSIRPTLFRTGQSRLTHLVSFRWNNDFSRTNVVLSWRIAVFLRRIVVFFQSTGVCFLSIHIFFQRIVIRFREIEVFYQTMAVCFQTIVVY